MECKGDIGLIKQQEFYDKYVRRTKERVVVIISDAFRFEVGQTLLKRLAEDEKMHCVYGCYAKCPAILHKIWHVVICAFLTENYLWRAESLMFWWMARFVIT